MKRLKLLLLSALVLLAVTSCIGCSTAGYYSQSIRGHLSLMNQRVPIEELLEEDKLDEKIRQRLEVAVEVRDFASRELDLPDNGSYRSYVELNRDYVVWNVVAAAEFSLKPMEWCFPIAGCVTYRGYYQQADAEKFAAELSTRGYDVAVVPAPAYSTLGWFDDPLLSSMFMRGELIMAENVFHELAHQQLYIKDDSVFNEAFASSVGEEGVYRWLQSSDRLGDRDRYRQHLQRKSEFINLLRQTAERLKTLYQQPYPVEEMRQQKVDQFAWLEAEYTALKQQWGGYQGYDRWFDVAVNNARLASIAVYRDRVPDFLRWLASCDGELKQYYATVKKLSKLEKTERHEILTGPASCRS